MTVLLLFVWPREEDHVASYCELCDQNAGKGDDDGDDDDEENMDRRRKPIEPLPRVNHDEIEYPEVEFAFYKPHPEPLAKQKPECDQIPLIENRRINHVVLNAITGHCSSWFAGRKKTHSLRPDGPLPVMNWKKTYKWPGNMGNWGKNPYLLGGYNRHLQLVSCPILYPLSSLGPKDWLTLRGRGCQSTEGGSLVTATGSQLSSARGVLCPFAATEGL